MPDWEGNMESDLIKFCKDALVNAFDVNDESLLEVAYDVIVALEDE